ncbi:ANTAR domain-containing response regulator [Butyricicoccus intestinisimiae]|uniref:ANTAR domain-containing protein n=1 Tax=Butyricicoccus intestinisimiae TaxID=2841509 RepID=A0ABS6ETX5_9FIRM|nr:ANTAR domain-containing protein [Butyricicoccus intestinisimiae]MBU5490657.1 ANTAR domain-containing protein [Butyricicoccus intestinisimiae]
MKRILLVGTSAKHMDDMKRIVYNVYAEKRIDSAYSAEQARGILQNNSFDFVIVDISSVNSWEYQITHTIYKQTSAFVLILVPQKFSTPVQNGHFRGMAVEKPISRVTFAQVLRLIDWVLSLQKEKEELQQRLSDICIVSRAKRLLMKKKQMSESEAYLYIKNQAMNQHQAKRAIAQNILNHYQT